MKTDIIPSLLASSSSIKLLRLVLRGIFECDEPTQCTASRWWTWSGRKVIISLFFFSQRGTCHSPQCGHDFTLVSSLFCSSFLSVALESNRAFSILENKQTKRYSWVFLERRITGKNRECDCVAFKDNNIPLWLAWHLRKRTYIIKHFQILPVYPWCNISPSLANDRSLGEQLFHGRFFRSR